MFVGIFTFVSVCCRLSFCCLIVLLDCYTIFVLTKQNEMQTVKTNIWGLKIGDRITFTNSVNYKVDILVTRVEEKSWYALGRNSYGTLQSYSKYQDFKIIKSK